MSQGWWGFARFGCSRASPLPGARPTFVRPCYPAKSQATSVRHRFKPRGLPAAPLPSRVRLLCRCGPAYSGPGTGGNRTIEGEPRWVVVHQGPVALRQDLRPAWISSRIDLGDECCRHCAENPDPPTTVSRPSHPGSMRRYDAGSLADGHARDEPAQIRARRGWDKRSRYTRAVSRRRSVEAPTK